MPAAAAPAHRVPPAGERPALGVYFPEFREEESYYDAYHAREQYLDCIRTNPDDVFDIVKYDGLFPSIQEFKDRALIDTDRLKSAIRLVSLYRDEYLNWLRENAAGAVEIVIEFNDLTCLNTLAELGVFTGDNIDGLIELANASQKVAFRFLDLALCKPEYQTRNIETLGIDGKYFRFSPDFIFELYKQGGGELNHSYLHSVFHCVFSHPFVNPAVNRDLWDLACDIAVELAALEQGGELTAERLYKCFMDKPPSPGGISAFMVCSAGMNTVSGMNRRSKRKIPCLRP